MAMALMVAISTAPAAMSFASLASGSNEVVAMSIAASIAELIISAIRTNAIESSSAISSSRSTPIERPRRARRSRSRSGSACCAVSAARGSCPRARS